MTEAEEVAAFYRGSPPREHRSLPYVRVTSRPVIRQTDYAGDQSFTYYERSPVDLRCRLGLHPLEVVIDYWIVFMLGRRLECPCGKKSLIEVY